MRESLEDRDSRWSHPRQLVFLRSAGGFDTAGAKLSLLYITGLHFFNLGEKEPIADNEHVAFPKYRRESINNERLRQ